MFKQGFQQPVVEQTEAPKTEEVVAEVKEEGEKKDDKAKHGKDEAKAPEVAVGPEQVEALRLGGDQFLTKPTNPIWIIRPRP